MWYSVSASWVGQSVDGCQFLCREMDRCLNAALGMVTYDQSDVTDRLSEWWRLHFTRLVITLNHWCLTVRGSVTVADESSICGDRCHLTWTALSVAKLSQPSKLPSQSEWVNAGMMCCCNLVPSDLWTAKRLFDVFWLMCSGVIWCCPTSHFSHFYLWHFWLILAQKTNVESCIFNSASKQQRSSFFYHLDYTLIFAQ